MASKRNVALEAMIEEATVDLDCLSRYDGLLAIRLNPLGAHALGLAGDYHPPSSTTLPERILKVLPTLDIGTGTTPCRPPAGAPAARAAGTGRRGT